MFIGQFTYQIFTGGANEVIQRRQLKERFESEFKAETLSAIQKEFWNFFHRNGIGYSNWHIHIFISGQITDTITNNTWPCDSYGKKIGGKSTMALPTYNKNDRRKSFELLPKGAYVIRILGAKEEPKKNGKTGTNLVIAFDIAEGEYANFYNKQFEGNSDENKKWPNDGTYYLNVPGDDSPAYVWTNWNSFFADLEDSNNGFIFSGDVKSLKGKLIGGKFANDQSSYNGNVYDHTRLKWTCVADDVRSGKPGKMPKDKLVANSQPATKTPDGFMDIPEGAEDELPF